MISRQNSIATRQNNRSTAVWLATLLLLAVSVHVVFLAVVRQDSFQVLSHKHRSHVKRRTVQFEPPRNAKLLLVQAFVVQGARTPLSDQHSSGLEWTDCPAASNLSRSSTWPVNSSSISHGILGNASHGLLAGGCQQGMLTSHGYQTSFNIGAYLRRQYIDRYSLLPPRYSPSSLVATSNSQQATVDSLHTVVLALYPNASNVSIQLVQDKAGRAQNKGIGSDMLGTRCRKLVQLQGKLQLLQENKGGSVNSAEWQLLATRVQDLLLNLNTAINNMSSRPTPADHPANTKAVAGARAHAASLASSILQSIWRATSSVHDLRSRLQPFDSSMDSLQDRPAENWQLDQPGRQMLQHLRFAASPAVVKGPQAPHRAVPATHKNSPAVTKVPLRSHQTVAASHKVSPAGIQAPGRPKQAVQTTPKSTPSAVKRPVLHQQAVHSSKITSASSSPTQSSRSAADNPQWDHFLDELTCIAAREDASISSKARDVLFYLEPWMLQNKLAIIAPGPKECLSSKADCAQVNKLGVGRQVHEILLQWQAAVSTAEMLSNKRQDETYRPGPGQISRPNPRPLSWSDVMHVADPMQQPKLFLHGVEETTLVLLLRALRVQPAEWPSFSSHLELELWQHSVPKRHSSTPHRAPHCFIRVMYQGLPILFTKRVTQLQGTLLHASNADSDDHQLQERDFLCAYNRSSSGSGTCHHSNKAVGLPVVSLEDVKALAMDKLALDAKQYAVACGGGNPAAVMD